MASAFSLLALFTLVILSLPVLSPAYLPDASISTMAPGLVSILSNLGFQELASASRSISLNPGQFSPPLTIFAAYDESIRSCSGNDATCSVSRLLEEHVVPGLFSHFYLSKLSFGTKQETVSPNRCLTVTSTVRSDSRSNSTAKIFIDGVQVTHPDLFNDGHVIVHGIQGFVAPLSPFSCLANRSHSASAVMLRDIIIRLRNSRYGVLALALKIKSPELFTLQNMTIFALDDSSIFGWGGQGYIYNVRFHVVPNRLLMYEDLMKLPVGTVLPTLVKGEYVVIMNKEVGPGGLRINHAPIWMGNVFSNSKIAVHSLHFPLPHLYFEDTKNIAAGNGGPGGDVCGIGNGGQGCGMRPSTPLAYGSSSAAHGVHGDDSL